MYVRGNRRGRVFVDTARMPTRRPAAPAYAVRARDGAPVATPLYWDELDNPGIAPDQFNIRNIFDRLKKMRDPWKDVQQHSAEADRLPVRLDSPDA
jgi:bifunctional non-homologous end joining protein LigD